jgi:hypothetical protein
MAELDERERGMAEQRLEAGIAVGVPREELAYRCRASSSMRATAARPAL